MMKTGLIPRDNTIDLLRAIAIIGICAAHTFSNGLILQMRSFDVPMMVFLSGLCYKTSACGYGTYVWKRFLRLIVPTWIFLTLYALICFFTGPPLLKKDLLEYFTLFTDWYVWIIRVFFTIALLAPILIKAGNALGKIGFGIVSLIIICSLSFLKDLSASRLFQYTLTTIPYCLFFYFGHLSRSISSRGMGGISLASGLIFLAGAVYFYLKNQTFIPTWHFKYPPQLYYVSYAMACIGILFILRQPVSRFLERIYLARFFSFVGSHTLWLYFYHIIMLFALKSISISSPIRFLSVFVGALLLTGIHNLVFKKIENKTIKAIFIG